jgi:hypothetical protein
MLDIAACSSHESAASLLDQMDVVSLFISYEKLLIELCLKTIIRNERVG